LSATDLATGFAAGWDAGRLDLNIFNMRSVMTKPPTMLLVAATTAMNPKTVARWLLCSPTSTMAPTTAIASKALVSDISGVCSSGETRRITSNPMKPASTKIKSALIKVEVLFIFPLSLSDLLAVERRASRPASVGIPTDGRDARRSTVTSPERQSQQLANPRLHDLTAAGQQSLANNLIFEVQIQLLIFD